MSKPHNIFISLSGERSKTVALAFKEWLPAILQSAEPWMSETDKVPPTCVRALPIHTKNGRERVPELRAAALRSSG